MPDSVPRRRLLAQLGAVCSLPLAGCRVLGPTSSAGPIEPQETTPVRAQGDSLTVTRSVSSTNATVLANGSVDPGTGDAVEPLSSWASSRSVSLAESAIRDVLADRVDEHRESPVEWDLRWDVTHSRFLLTVTTRLDPPVDAVVWPSRVYDDLESSAPKSVTVIVRTDERSVSNEFPVYTRAKLRSTSGSSRRP